MKRPPIRRSKDGPMIEGRSLKLYEHKNPPAAPPPVKPAWKPGQGSAIDRLTKR